MKEVSYLLRRKGQGLVNELESSIMFARHHLKDNATAEQRALVEEKVKTLKDVIKKVQNLFELNDNLPGR